MLRTLFLRTPVAWQQLVKEKTRLAVAVAGIAFANLLIFIQLGFQDALYDGATQPHRLLQADLVLISPQLQSLFALQSFPRERLYQTLSHEGVASVSSIYIDTAKWKNPDTRLTRSILVWGVDPTAPSLNFPEIKQNVQQLQLLDRILFDHASRPEYGAIGELIQKQGTMEAELNSQNIQVAGLFTLGASFAADGNVITSNSTFLKLFPERKPDRIEVGLIQVKPGVNIAQVQEQLRAELRDVVKVVTPEEFAAIEKLYWESQGAIGFIFGLGVIVGFIVGLVIVYQILHTDVVNHLPEYATLKAMGYGNSYFLGILLQEALILAILGYIPGFIISIGLYQIAYWGTLLPIGMKLDRAIFVLVLTIIMCTISGAIALQKLRSADPADIF
jgi:putative ABC transport system permease protein